jgi:hypothetical protein
LPPQFTYEKQVKWLPNNALLEREKEELESSSQARELTTTTTTLYLIPGLFNPSMYVLKIQKVHFLLFFHIWSYILLLGNIHFLGYIVEP